LSLIMISWTNLVAWKGSKNEKGVGGGQERAYEAVYGKRNKARFKFRTCNIAGK